jgi:hypothetical protein
LIFAGLQLGIVGLARTKPAEAALNHLFGEGGYQQSELILQQLLEEAGAGEQDHQVVTVDPQGAEAVADWNDLLSPENYVGYDRTETFSSGDAKHDKGHDYTAPAQLKLNHWALSGNLTVGGEAVVLNNASGRILYQFHARDLHLVMGPSVPGIRVRFRVLIDGESRARTWSRRRRTRQRNGRRAAHVSTDMAAEADR